MPVRNHNGISSVNTFRSAARSSSKHVFTIQHRSLTNGTCVVYLLLVQDTTNIKFAIFLSEGSTCCHHTNEEIK